MKEAGELLDNAEVEFLLDGNDPGEATATPGPEESPAEVTMHGDLERMSLTDVVQTVSMSKLEGLLRIRNPLEQRQLYFKDGFVRCLSQQRAEVKRLGQRLIHSGLISMEQLRSALLEQKKTRRHLGQILVDEGAVEEAQIEGIVVSQVEEDLLGVFTWQHGNFEFFKGATTDPELIRRLEMTPEFDVGGILLEVARRSDEWELIVQTLRSTDEIFEVTGSGDENKLDSTERAVLEAVDGRHSAQDLSDQTLLPVFECARAMRGLVQRGLVQEIGFDAGLEIVEGHLQHGHSKVAMVTLRALLLRPGPRPLEVTVALAEALQKCGEHRWAAQLLVEAARDEEDQETVLELARMARKVSSRSVDTLRFLHETLRDFGSDSVEDGEFVSVSADLAECLFEEGSFEESLGLLEAVERIDPGDPQTLSRKAKILNKLGRSEEAIAVLLSLAERYKTEKRNDKLAAVYEQILKIDYRRKDIARALKVLHSSHITKRVRAGVMAAAFVGAACGGYWWWQDQGLQQDLRSLEALVRVQLNEVGRHLSEADAKFAAGDADAGMAGLQQAMASVRVSMNELQNASENLGQQETIDRLRNSLMAALDQAKSRKLAVQKDSQGAILDLASQDVAAGDISAALERYASLLRQGMNRDSLEKAARVEFSTAANRIRRLGQSLPQQVPEPPSLLQSHAERRAVLASIDENFLPEDRRLIETSIENDGDALMLASLGQGGYGDYMAQVRTLKEVFDRAAEVREAYDSEVGRTKTALKLTPVYQAAKEFEETFQFDKARQTYLRLAREHPENDELKGHFQDQVERYSAILRFLEVIRTATEEGDFQTARGQLRTMERTFSGIPFDQLASLPLMVRSTPAGARVSVNGEVVGTTPCRTSFFPGKESTVRIELPGYYPEQATVLGDETGLLRSYLTRVPNWTRSTEGVVQDAAMVGADGRFFVSERNGRISALDPSTGDEQWSFDTGDMSGYLTRPVAGSGDGSILVASVDGTLRCLDQDTGELRWSAGDLPCRSAPVVFGERILLATDDGRLLCLSAFDGSTLFSIDLDGPVQVDLAALPNRALVLTSPGTLYSIRPKDGHVVWQNKVGRGVIGQPVLSGTTYVCASDEGRVCAVNTADGSTSWEREGLGEILLGGASDGRRLFLAQDKTLLCLDLDSGRELGRMEHGQRWRADLSCQDGSLFAGDETGLVEVYRGAEFEIAYRIRGDAPLAAPVSGTGGAGVHCLFFEDRSIQGVAPETGR